MATERDNNVTMTTEMSLDDSDKHCSAVLDSVNSIREKGDLCDASLKVGEKKILVHKCILVGGSDYFRSRFIGPLKEDKPEVDLSSVTDNVDSVEAVVNFLYTGKIKVDADNLAAILKISSYLLITKLHQFCIKYMLKKVDLDTCLQYFLLAVEYDIKEVVDKLKLTVTSRFHDWLIFIDSSLSLSSNQLLFLINECNIFEHCNIIDSLYFVINWIECGTSESHESLACDILDFVTAKEKQFVDNVYSCGYVKEYLDQTQTMAELVTVGPRLRSKLKKALKMCSDLLERLPKQMTLCRLESPAQQCSLDTSEKEDVLIVFSPKQCLKDLKKFPGKISDDEEDIPDGTAIYDVCAYIPKTQTWSYMGGGVAEDINVMRFLTYSSVRIFPYRVCFFRNTLCVVYPLIRFIQLLNFVDFSCTAVDLVQILPDPASLERCGHRVLVCTDDTLYLILTVRVYLQSEDISPTHIYFKCYRLTSENTWLHVFDTPRIDTRLEFEEVSIAISSVSKEMMIVHNGSKLHVFVAVLSAKEPSAIEVEMFAKESYISAREQQSHVHIIETKSHFHLLIVVFRKDENTALVSYRYRYKFSSSELESVEGCELTVNDFPTNDLSTFMFPCMARETTYGKRSMWMFCGTAEHGSSLVEVTVDENGKLVQYKHKPPPFSCVSVITVGQLSCHLLASRQPIFEYLTP